MKNNERKTVLFSFVLVFILTSLITFLYVKGEDNVYVYDYVGYQLRFNTLSDLFKNDFLGALRELWQSIRVLDYNYFPVLFLVPFNLLF